MDSNTSRFPSIKFPSFSGLDYHELRRKVSRAIRVKSLYTRITLTPFTLIYFLLAVLTCIVMTALQGVVYNDNTTGVHAIGPIISNARLTNALTLNANGGLYYCSQIPSMNAAQCNRIATNQTTDSTAGGGGGSGFVLTWKRDLRVPRVYAPIEPRRLQPSAKWRRTLPADNGEVKRRSAPTQSVLPLQDNKSKSKSKPKSLARKAPTRLDVQNTPNATCAQALLWLEGSLNSEREEDVVMLSFQFWLFSLSVIAILSESLPHLGAAFIGHIVGTAWAGARIRLSYDNMNVYNNQVVAGACGGRDILGLWWQLKISHMIPIAVVNAIVLIFMLFLTYKIYRTYSKQTFNSVGATPAVERILKMVLLLSVTLHLTVFFVIATAAVWINKATTGLFSFLTKNERGFVAAAALTIVMVLPWMYAGWSCVRRECQWRFLAFCIMSVLLITLFTMMFWSPTYRFIFTSWPFFAGIAIVAYAMVILSTILAIWCRFNFGQGFAHFMQVSEVLEDMDFPNVPFPKQGVDERGMRTVSGQVLQIPPAANRPISGFRSMRFMRASVYSNHNLATVKLSSSQPLHSDIVNTKVPTPTSPTFQRASTLTVTQRLRRVFEYRRSGGSSSESSLALPVQSIPPVPALPSVSPTGPITLAPAPKSAPAPAPNPPSPEPILTHQIAQRSRRKLEPVRPSNRPPPLKLSQDDDAFRGRINLDRDVKRRSRSVDLGRGTRSAREPTLAGLDSSLVVAPTPRSAKVRPLPIRPLPRPPATAPLTLDDAPVSSSGPALVRRGATRSDSKPFNEQW